MGNGSEESIRVAQERVDSLAAQLEQAKDTVRQWTYASANLSRSAAEARAENQGLGRGIGGMLLGSKFRSAMRRTAAQSNAAIAREVAEERASIAEGKRAAETHVRSLQTALRQAQADLKALIVATRVSSKSRSEPVRAASQALSLLRKLKEAHELGLLTDEEYEEKRRKLSAEI